MENMYRALAVMGDKEDVDQFCEEVRRYAVEVNAQRRLEEQVAAELQAQKEQERIYVEDVHLPKRNNRPFTWKKDQEETDGPE